MKRLIGVVIVVVAAVSCPALATLRKDCPQPVYRAESCERSR